MTTLSVWYYYTNSFANGQNNFLQIMYFLFNIFKVFIIIHKNMLSNVFSILVMNVLTSML